MKVVQALRWLRDTMPQDKDRIVRRIRSILDDPKHGKRVATISRLVFLLSRVDAGFVREFFIHPEKAQIRADDSLRVLSKHDEPDYTGSWPPRGRIA